MKDSESANWYEVEQSEQDRRRPQRDNVTKTTRKEVALLQAQGKDRLRNRTLLTGSSQLSESGTVNSLQKDLLDVGNRR